MKALITAILLLNLFAACSKSDNDGGSGSASSSPTNPQNPDTGVIDEDTTTDDPVVTACEMFEHSVMQLVFPNMFANCADLSEEKVRALTVSYTVLLENESFTKDDSHEKCPVWLGHSLKRFFRMALMELRSNGETLEYVDQLKKELVKSQFDRHLRKVNKECLSQNFDGINVEVDETFTFSYALDNQYLVNRSFELVKLEKNGEDIKTQIYPYNWDLLTSSQVPGWKVRGNLPEQHYSEDRNCELLEIQRDGLTPYPSIVPPTHGNQIAELDSHCVDMAGYVVNEGDHSNVTISQNFIVNEIGTYKFEFDARKRQGLIGGTFDGGLFYQIHEKGEAQGLIPYELNNENAWQRVCVDYEVVEPHSQVVIKIADKKIDRPNYGIFVDNASFSQGSCE